jgi:hypothetical protein
LGALPVEKNFNYEAYVQFTLDNYHIPVGCVVAYMAFCYFGSKIMEKRQPFDLQMPLALWNAFLCVFSFIGMCRTVPYLFHFLTTGRDFHTLICQEGSHFGNGIPGIWVMFFCFSKIPELIDTVFIVLRKKPLIFLHWYHHVTVLLYCWHAFSTKASVGIYFVAMNYTVHALMYGYYCLQALKMVPKNFPAHLITLSQIAQMFIGTFICGSTIYFAATGQTCNVTSANMVAAGLMYGSYLYLFCEFAVKRYIFKKPSSGKGKSAPKDE